MQVYGVMMVRNEVDVIRVNILYHLALGFDKLLVVDNGSTDGTGRELRRLARGPRVECSRDEGNFRQGEVFTELARRAHREGADWVFPMDADEFWSAPGGDFRNILDRTEATVLKVRALDFVQRRDQKASSPKGLLSMTYRIPEPVARQEGYEDLLAADRISYIELARVPKSVSRSSATLRMVRGGHTVGGFEGESAMTGEISILHAPLRSFAGLEAKALSTERRGQSGSESSGPGWHARRWSRLRREGRLEEEWAANSYADGCLDVYGERHPLIFDTALRDAVAPFVTRSLWNRLRFSR